MIKQQILHLFKRLPGIMPMLFFGVAISAAITILVPIETVTSLLGNQAGFFGILFGVILGFILPNVPFMALPIIGSLARTGAGLPGLVAILSSWSLFALYRYPIELGIIGPKLSLKRSLYALPVPFLTSGLVFLAQKAFGFN